jgi:peptidoglycan/xylan/chitin deacetylase (PgdA/CDA1 family)
VLAYHSVGGARHARDELCTSVERLAEHLDALAAEGYRLTGLTDALNAQPAADAAPPAVAITFDDAYADFLDAVPVLAERQVAATLYVPSGLIGRTAEWLSGADRKRPLLRREHLDALAASGMEIGAHGRYHHALDIADTRSRHAEIAVARRELQDCVGVPVQSFAYPYGYWTQRCRAEVAAAGYDNACVLGHALHRRAGDRFAVRRLLITSADDADTVLRRVRGSRTSPRALVTTCLRGPWRWARWAESRWRRP